MRRSPAANADTHCPAWKAAFHDLAKIAPIRLARSWAHELGLDGATAVCVMPGWLRSEMMLDRYGVTEEAWRDACAADTTGYR